MRHDTRSAALHHQQRVARRRLAHQIGAPITRIKRISATPIIPGQSTILHERPTPTTTFRESPGLVVGARFPQWMAECPEWASPALTIGTGFTASMAGASE